MSNELEKKTDQQVYHNLAEDYRSIKTTAMNSVLQCGKILNDARDQMGSAGMFKHFLEDSRVAESERTAARLISVYKNFRHILNQPDKLKVFSQLGVSHLLELKKLPERFTKKIEIIIEKQGEELKEICSVIDEEKLADFLDETTDEKYWVDGKPQKVRDLTASEMRKIVNEQAGMFEPDNYFEETPAEEKRTYGTPIPDIPSQDEDTESEPFMPKINGGQITEVHEPEVISTQNLADLLEFTEKLLVFQSNSLGCTTNITDIEINTGSEKTKETLKNRIPQIISKSEALIVQLTELKERL